MSDDLDIDDLTDAIIEDTCHCDLCGGSFVLGGGNDYVIVDLERQDVGFGKFGPQLKLCIECARMVHDGYRECLAQACVCEHGIADDEYCEECSGERKRARRAHGLDDD